MDPAGHLACRRGNDGNPGDTVRIAALFPQRQDSNSVNNMMHGLVTFAAAALLGGSAVPAPAQEDSAPVRDAEAEAEALAAYLIAANPGEEHERLASLEGTWAVTGRFWSEPGADPITATHSSKMRMALGQRYLIEDLEGDMWGEEFRGIGITAYDNVEEEYITTWIDNLSTGILVLRGRYDPDRDAVVMTGEYTDPVTELKRSLQSVERVTESGTRIYEHWEVADDGSEFKVMELTYLRHRSPE